MNNKACTIRTHLIARFYRPTINVCLTHAVIHGDQGREGINRRLYRRRIRYVFAPRVVAVMD
jgi:hypothetical protein